MVSDLFVFLKAWVNTLLLLDCKSYFTIYITAYTHLLAKNHDAVKRIYDLMIGSESGWSTEEYFIEIFQIKVFRCISLMSLEQYQDALDVLQNLNPHKYQTIKIMRCSVHVLYCLNHIYATNEYGPPLEYVYNQYSLENLTEVFQQRYFDKSHLYSFLKFSKEFFKDKDDKLDHMNFVNSSCISGMFRFKRLPRLPNIKRDIVKTENIYYF